MKGARAVAGALLMLALVCALPAVSAAQDDPSSEPTTTTAPEPVAPLAEDPQAPADPPAAQGGGAENGGRERGEDDEGGGGSQGAGESQGTSQVTATAEPSVSPGNGPGRARASASASVTMGDNFFSPPSVTVSVGDIVTWKNKGKAPHTATADDGSFDTGTVVSGQNASHMFTSAGTFSYICTIHPEMKGSVRVLSAGGGGKNGAGSAGSSSASAPTEAQAVASPEAAGNATTLPATGLAAVPLALVGLAMLGSGLTLKYRFITRRSAQMAPPSPAGRVDPENGNGDAGTRRANRRAAGTVAIIGLAVLAVGLLVRHSSAKGARAGRISSGRASPRFP